MENILSIELLKRVDRICDEYESCFQRGEATSLAQVVESAPAELRSLLVSKIVPLDMELRKRRGAPTALQAYCQELPMYRAQLEEHFASKAFQNEQTCDYSSREALPRTESGDQIQIPNYRLVRRLGGGGFAYVYEAHRNSDGQRFAVKLLRAETSLAPEGKRRFLREAMLLSQLKHRRIIGFHELGIVENVLYLVMDYVEATDWDAIATTLSVPRRILVAAGIISHVLEGLVFAHEQGVVHRDIKPANILLEQRGTTLKVRLADFGLAKGYLHAGHSGITDDNQIAGTVGYMAPELLKGVRYYQPASDQYAAAATLYYYLAGQSPITVPSGHNPIQTLQRHEIPPIQQACSAIPASLAAWINRGLHPDPKRRFSSTQSMLDALKQVLPTARQ